MDVYSYRYTCKTWYWTTTTGIRNFYSNDPSMDDKIEKAAIQDAKRANNSAECDIQLLQKFKMTVTDVQTFPAMAAQPLHQWSSSHRS